MLKLMYYVPESHLESTKQAIFQAGAGQFSQDGQLTYTQCAWQVKGIGQFMPMLGSHPFLGTSNQLEQVEEWRVEVIVAKEMARQVKTALLDSHPYEEVAYEFYTILTID